MNGDSRTFTRMTASILIAVIMASVLMPAMISETRKAGTEQSNLPYSNTIASKPPWVFVGGYLNYSFANSQGNQITSGYNNVTITGVDISNQSFAFTSYRSLNNSKPVHYNGSASYVHPQYVILASNITDLKIFGAGSVPRNYLPINVPNVIYNYSLDLRTLKVAGHTIQSYVLTVNMNSSHDTINRPYTSSESIWIDQSTGLWVKDDSKYSSTLTGTTNGNVTLVRTNMLHSESKTILPTLEILVPIMVVAVILSYVIYKKRSSKINLNSENGADLMEVALNSAAEKRIQELKSLLDKGVIDKQYFDESVNRLRSKSSNK